MVTQSELLTFIPKLTNQHNGIYGFTSLCDWIFFNTVALHSFYYFVLLIHLTKKTLAQTQKKKCLQNMFHLKLPFCRDGILTVLFYFSEATVEGQR